MIIGTGWLHTCFLVVWFEYNFYSGGVVIVSSLVECDHALGILTKVEIVGIGSNSNNWFNYLAPDGS